MVSVFFSDFSGKTEQEDGFSLLELMIVIVVVGIMFGLALPLFSGSFERTKFKKELRCLVATLEYAHRLATVKRLNYRVNFDLNRNRYWLSVEKSPYQLPESYFRVETSGRKIHYLAQGVSIEKIASPRDLNRREGEDYVTFYPQGSSEDVTLFLKGGDKELCKVRILRTTGVAVVE